MGLVVLGQPSRGEGAGGSPPKEYEQRHAESRADLTPILQWQEFLVEFVASGGDAGDLPRFSLPAGGYPLSQDMGDLLSRSVAVVRGRVIEEDFYGRAGLRDGIAQFFCYATFVVEVEEVLRGQAQRQVRIVQNGCPYPDEAGPALLEPPWEPLLRRGADYILVPAPYRGR